MKCLEIGSVSSGTLRDEDLYPAFWETLESLDPVLVHGIPEEMPEDLDAREDAFDSLWSRLYEVSPAYTYFGASEGDGANFGCWIDWTPLEDDIRSKEVLEVKDLSEVEFPVEDHDYVMVINERGNTTLYDSKGELIWSVV